MRECLQIKSNWVQKGLKDFYQPINQYLQRKTDNGFMSGWLQIHLTSVKKDPKCQIGFHPPILLLYILLLNSAAVIDLPLDLVRVAWNLVEKCQKRSKRSNRGFDQPGVILPYLLLFVGQCKNYYSRTTLVLEWLQILWKMCQKGSKMSKRIRSTRSLAVLPLLNGETAISLQHNYLDLVRKWLQI